MRLRIAEMARKNRGWNMRKLAEELGLSHQAVMYWNQGRSYPRFLELVKMCRLLGCTLAELLDEETLQAIGEPLEDEAGQPLENIPQRRRGHAPQVITSHDCRMGSL